MDAVKNTAHSRTVGYIPADEKKEPKVAPKPVKKEEPKTK